MKDDLVEQLRDEAGRNGGQGAYAWRPRELCGKAAAKILSLQSQLAAAQEKLARAEKALAGLVTHPNDYHDCADDDLALILVRDIRRARTTLAALREPAAEEGRGANSLPFSVADHTPIAEQITISRSGSLRIKRHD